ncbi:MAG: DUF5989 family protein [Gemmatimonadetes bacterium]|nr:DUF5989 family protein [Gemmatimonadota bacterium]
MKQSSIVADYLRFFKARKKYWMIPIVLVLILMGTLVVVLEGFALSPFIYAIF